MGIIKKDIKTFYKPMILYLLSAQFFIFIGSNISNWITSQSRVIEYFLIFVIAVCIIEVIVSTILFAIYFNTKSNAAHLEEYELTDGYGLYRFIVSSLFLFTLFTNFVIAFELNDYNIIETLLNLKYYHIASSLFALIPIYMLIVISIGHVHKRRIVRNTEAVVSILAIFVGIYIAGNLYYFGNPHQGVAVLVALFIPVTILYMSLKNRNSQNSLYKIIIFILCIFVSFSTIVLIVTSEFKYDTKQDEYYGEAYQPEFYKSNASYTTETLDSHYGQILHTTSVQDGSQTDVYTLTTDSYNYRFSIYGGSELNAQITEFNSPNSINIYDSEYQTEAEFMVDRYEPESDNHMTCNVPYTQLNDDSDCLVDQEVIDVFELVKSYLV